MNARRTSDPVPPPVELSDAVAVLFAPLVALAVVGVLFRALRITRPAASISAAMPPAVPEPTAAELPVAPRADPPAQRARPSLHTTAVAINAHGQIAGDMADMYLPPHDAHHAFVWTPGVGPCDLGTLGGDTSRAAALNDRGEVVGTAATADGAEHAFLWSADAGMQDLGAPEDAWSRAYGVNARGHVVGESALLDSDLVYAFRWTPEEAIEMLELKAAAPSTAWDEPSDPQPWRCLTAWGIWEDAIAGRALHDCRTGEHPEMAYVRLSHDHLELVGLDDYLPCYPRAITSLRRTAGDAELVNASRRAVLWDATAIRDLGVLAG